MTEINIPVGWREYQVNHQVDRCDRMFCKKFGDQQITLRLWDFRKYDHPIRWDITGNFEYVHVTISIELDNLNEECEKMLRMFKAYN